MGLARPTAGSVSLELDGVRHELTGRPPQDIVGLGVALVPEGRRLFPRLTVKENLLLGAYRSAARSAIERNLALCYEAFPVLRERPNQLAGSMSGGQQQMLAIARAIMSSPRVLLVDEPSVGLSPMLVRQTIDIIGELKRRFGLTVLMAEQNFHEASRIADRGYIIVHGEIAFEGRDLEELRDSELVRSHYLGA
jgi:branched-chain amino acid transport system ATP-binding protein